MKWFKEESEKPEPFESVVILYRILCDKCGDGYNDNENMGIGFYFDEWSLCDIYGVDSEQRDISSYKIKVSYWTPIPSFDEP